MNQLANPNGGGSLKLTKNDVLCLLGSSCYWSWVILDRSGLVSQGSTFLQVHQFMFSAAMAITGLFLFAFANRMSNPYFKKALCLSTVGLVGVGYLGVFLGNGNDTIFFVSNTLLSFARGCLMQLWVLWLFSVRLERVPTILLGNVATSAAIVLIVSALPAGAVSFILPMLATTASLLTLVRLANGDVLFTVPQNRTATPFKAVGFLAIQSFVGFAIGVLGILGARSAIMLSPFQHVFMVVSACLLLTIWALASRSTSFSWKTTLVFPAALSALFVLPFGVSEYVLPKTAFVLCWLISPFITYPSIVNYSKSRPATLASTALLGQVVCSIGTVVGNALISVIRNLFVDGIIQQSSSIMGISLAISFAFLALAMAFLQTLAPHPESSPAQKAHQDVETAAYLEKCSLVARQYSLTPREAEVLVLLGEGYSRPHIGKELYLSESTIKSHANSIYRKLGIHKHDELLLILR